MKIKKFHLFIFFLLCNCPVWSQNVTVQNTFTFYNSATKTFTVADLSIINLPSGATANWYDALTGGNQLSLTTPLQTGKTYYLETTPKAAIGIRLQTIVYEISPILVADKLNVVCSGDLVTISANNLLTTEQFTNENTNGKGLDLTKITQYGNDTYYIRKLKMSWEDARALINTIPGATMYTIKSTAQENAVFAALQASSLTGNDGIAYWLGLKQYNTASDFSELQGIQSGWYWNDGTPLSYSNWSAGEPNDYRDHIGFTPSYQLYEVGGIDDEDYAQMEFQTNGIKWNDAPNDSSNRNSYPIFQFTASTGLQWYKLNNITNNYDLLSGETTGQLTVTTVSGTQKYRLDFLTNGVTYSIFYDVVADIQLVFPIPANLTTICDDEINPLNQDGKSNFDTSTFDATLIGTQTGKTIKYFNQLGSALSSPLPNPFGSDTQNITVRVEQTSNPACFATAIIPLIVKPLPRIKTNNGGGEDITICSTGGSISTIINAGINDGTPTTDYTYIWFKGGSILTGESNATLTATSAGDYSVQVTSKTTNCSAVRIVKIAVTMVPQINPIPVNLTTSCEDEVDPLLQDGKASFNTSSIESTLLGGQTGMKVSYFDKNNVALSSPLPNPFVTNSQNVTVKIENASNPSCFTTAIIPFVVNPLPKIRTNSNGTENIKICSIAIPSSATLDAGIADSTPSTDYTYTWSKDGTVIAGETNATYIANTSGDYSVVVTSKITGCSATRKINFSISASPHVFSIDPSLTSTCDDEVDPLLQDGKASFDTSSFESTLLGGQTGMKVSYFDKNNVALSSPLPNPFVTNSQNVTVKIENASNPSCSISTIIPFVVHPMPYINSNANGLEDVLICSNNPSFSIQLTAGITDGSPTTNYLYTWFKEGVAIAGERNATLDNISIAGDYSVRVTAIATNCSSTRNIKVIPSAAPQITSIEIIDLEKQGNENSITINVASGQGKYLYSIDGDAGLFQESNTFSNLSPGIYNAYVKDSSNCGYDSRIAYVLGAPKFFTPNNDGYNDFWNIKGIDNDLYPNMTIYIFDRYGKLLKQISQKDNGWDGNYLGKPLPSNDYWFVLKFGNGREAKGHFALKR